MAPTIKLSPHAQTVDDIPDPVRDGRFWLFPDGTRLPVVSGGAVDDGGGEGGDDGSGGDGDGGSDGDKGGSGRDDQPTKDDVEKLKAALAKERASSREADKLRKKLKEYEDRDKSDADKAAEAEQRASGAELKALRLEVALEVAEDFQLGPKKAASLAPRLTGSTREELEADAKALFADFGGKKDSGKAGGGSFDAGARGSSGGSTDFNKVLRRAAGHHT